MGKTTAITTKGGRRGLTAAAAVLWLSIFTGVKGVFENGVQSEIPVELPSLVQHKTQGYRTSLGIDGSDISRKFENLELNGSSGKRNYREHVDVAKNRPLFSALQLEGMGDQSITEDGTDDNAGSSSSTESANSNEEQDEMPTSKESNTALGQSPKVAQDVKSGKLNTSEVEPDIRIGQSSNMDTSQSAVDVPSESEVPQQPAHPKAEEATHFPDKETPTMPQSESSPEKSLGSNSDKKGHEAEIRTHHDKSQPLCTPGKCYADLHERAQTASWAVLEKAQKNPHFNSVNQGFCDELFRLIDGPFPVSQVSAFLREADTADKMEKNFRYCLASADSSVPRVQEGYSILHAAIASHKPQIVELLLQYGAFPNMPLVPIRRVAFTSLDTDTIERVNMRPIHVAAEVQGLDGIQCINFLLNYEAEVDSRDIIGRTPLMIAARNNTPMSPEFVKELINAGSDVHAKDLAGLQALHYAVIEDNWRVVKILLDHQADPLVVDVEGNSPLHYAASFNAIHSVNKLLDKAGQFIQLNRTNSNGKAAIHLAAAPESYQPVSRSVVPAMALEALLYHHADPLLKDEKGNNALSVASKGGYVEIVKRLISTTNMPAEERNLAGQTALQLVEHSHDRPTQEIKEVLHIYSEKKGCVEPPLVRDSIRIFSDTVLGPYMRIGDTVTYICNDGYELYGHASITCQERNGIMEFVPPAPLCLAKTEAEKAHAPAFQPVFTVGLVLTIVNILVAV